AARVLRDGAGGGHLRGGVDAVHRPRARRDPDARGHTRLRAGRGGAPLGVLAGAGDPLPDRGAPDGAIPPQLAAGGPLAPLGEPHQRDPPPDPGRPPPDRDLHRALERAGPLDAGLPPGANVVTTTPDSLASPSAG